MVVAVAIEDIETDGLSTLRKLASADDPRPVKLMIDKFPTADS